MTLNINNIDTTSSLCIFLYIKDELKKISIENDTMQSLLELYRNKIKSYDGNIIPYKDRYGYKKERNELYEYEDFANLFKLKKYIEEISSNKQFDLNTDKLKELNFYVIKIPLTENSDLILFKKYQTIKCFYGTKPLFFTGTDFKEENSNNFLLFETDNIDFFIYENNIYIDNTFYFQMIAKENATDFSKAKEVINSINNFIPIQNIDTLIKDMESNNNVKRALLNISNNLDTISKLSIDNIKNIINEFSLNVEISDKNEIIYDSNHKSEILDIFQDNYLTSQITSIDYRTNSKIKVRN